MLSYDTLFIAMHLPVLPAWALLIGAPKARMTRTYVHSGLVPLILGALYGALLFSAVFLGYAAEGAAMGSLAGVMALFSHPVGTLTAWAHFICFDLFVGAWVARDAARRAMGHLGTLPALGLCFVFAPLGLAWHLLRRAALGHGIALGDGD